mgnify:CR=1 FL=1
MVAAPTSPSPIRLLIVEDDEMSRDLLQKRVSRAGYNVVAVADGNAALQKLSGQRFDLVLLDIMMPGIDGFEVCRRVQAEGDGGIGLFGAGHGEAGGNLLLAGLPEIGANDRALIGR